MINAQQLYQDQADKQKTTVPHFYPGDLVWFLSKNTDFPRLSRKLDHKREGHFKIMNLNLKTHYAYSVDFPADIKVDSVRHISDLEPAVNNTYPGQIVRLPPPVEIDGEEEWKLEEMHDAKIRYWKLQYLIEWMGYDIPDWRDAKDVNRL